MPTSFIQEMSDLQKQGGIFAGVKQLFAQYYASQLNTTLKEIQLRNKDAGKLETTEEVIGKVGTREIKIKTYGDMLEEIDNMRKGMTEQQNTFMSYLPIISYGNPELADRMTRSFFQNLGNDMNNVKTMQDQVQLLQANEYKKADTEINLLKADRDKFSITKFDNVVKGGKTYEQAWAINADNPQDVKLVKEVEVQGKGGSGSGAKFDKDVRSLFDPKENDAEIISLRTKIAGLQKFNTPEDLIAFKKAQGNTLDTDQVTGDTVKQFNEQQDKLKRDYTGLLTNQYYQKYLKRYQEGERTDGVASAWNEIVTLLNDGTKESKKAINVLRVNIGQSMGQKPEEVAIPFPEANRPEPDEKISTRFSNLEYKHVERYFAKYGLNSSTLTKEAAANFKDKLINDPEFRNEFKIDKTKEEDANTYQNRLQEYVDEIFRYGKTLIIGKKIMPDNPLVIGGNKVETLLGNTIYTPIEEEGLTPDEQKKFAMQNDPDLQDLPSEKDVVKLTQEDPDLADLPSDFKDLKPIPVHEKSSIPSINTKTFDESELDKTFSKFSPNLVHPSRENVPLETMYKGQKIDIRNINKKSFYELSPLEQQWTVENIHANNKISLNEWQSKTGLDRHVSLATTSFRGMMKDLWTMPDNLWDMISGRPKSDRPMRDLSDDEILQASMGIGVKKKLDWANFATVRKLSENAYEAVIDLSKEETPKTTSEWGAYTAGWLGGMAAQYALGGAVTRTLSSTTAGTAILAGIQKTLPLGKVVIPRLLEKLVTFEVGGIPQTIAAEDKWGAIKQHAQFALYAEAASISGDWGGVALSAVSKTLRSYPELTKTVTGAMASGGLGYALGDSTEERVAMGAMFLSQHLVNSPAIRSFLRYGTDVHMDYEGNYYHYNDKTNKFEFIDTGALRERGQIEIGDKLKWRKTEGLNDIIQDVPYEGKVGLAIDNNEISKAFIKSIFASPSYEGRKYIDLWDSRKLEKRLSVLYEQKKAQKYEEYLLDELRAGADNYLAESLADSRAKAEAYGEALTDVMMETARDVKANKKPTGTEQKENPEDIMDRVKNPRIYQDDKKVEADKPIAPKKDVVAETKLDPKDYPFPIDTTLKSKTSTETIKIVEWKKTKSGWKARTLQKVGNDWITPGSREWKTHDSLLNNFSAIEKSPVTEIKSVESVKTDQEIRDQLVKSGKSAEEVAKMTPEQLVEANTTIQQPIPKAEKATKSNYTEDDVRVGSILKFNKEGVDLKLEITTVNGDGTVIAKAIKNGVSNPKEKIYTISELFKVYSLEGEKPEVVSSEQGLTKEDAIFSKFHQKLADFFGFEVTGDANKKSSSKSALLGNEDFKRNFAVHLLLKNWGDGSTLRITDENKIGVNFSNNTLFNLLKRYDISKPEDIIRFSTVFANEKEANDILSKISKKELTKQLEYVGGITETMYRDMAQQAGMNSDASAKFSDVLMKRTNSLKQAMIKRISGEDLNITQIEDVAKNVVVSSALETPTGSLVSENVGAEVTRLLQDYTEYLNADRSKVDINAQRNGMLNLIERLSGVTDEKLLETITKAKEQLSKDGGTLQSFFGYLPGVVNNAKYLGSSIAKNILDYVSELYSDPAKAIGEKRVEALIMKAVNNKVPYELSKNAITRITQGLLSKQLTEEDITSITKELHDNIYNTELERVIRDIKDQKIKEKMALISSTINSGLESEIRLGNSELAELHSNVLDINEYIKNSKANIDKFSTMLSKGFVDEAKQVARELIDNHTRTLEELNKNIDSLSKRIEERETSFTLEYTYKTIIQKEKERDKQLNELEEAKRRNHQSKVRKHSLALYEINKSLEKQRNLYQDTMDSILEQKMALESLKKGRVRFENRLQESSERLDKPINEAEISKIVEGSKNAYNTYQEELKITNNRIESLTRSVNALKEAHKAQLEDATKNRHSEIQTIEQELNREIADLRNNENVKAKAEKNASAISSQIREFITPLQSVIEDVKGGKLSASQMTANITNSIVPEEYKSFIYNIKNAINKLHGKDALNINVLRQFGQRMYYTFGDLQEFASIMMPDKKLTTMFTVSHPSFFQMHNNISKRFALDLMSDDVNKQMVSLFYGIDFSNSDKYTSIYGALAGHIDGSGYLVGETSPTREIKKQRSIGDQTVDYKEKVLDAKSLTMFVDSGENYNDILANSNNRAIVEDALSKGLKVRVQQFDNFGNSVSRELNPDLTKGEVVEAHFGEFHNFHQLFTGRKSTELTNESEVLGMRQIYTDYISIIDGTTKFPITKESMEDLGKQLDSYVSKYKDILTEDGLNVIKELKSFSAKVLSRESTLANPAQLIEQINSITNKLDIKAQEKVRFEGDVKVFVQRFADVFKSRIPVKIGSGGKEVDYSGNLFEIVGWLALDKDNIFEKNEQALMELIVGGSGFFSKVAQKSRDTSGRIIYNDVNDIVKNIVKEQTQINEKLNSLASLVAGKEGKEPTGEDVANSQEFQKLLQKHEVLDQQRIKLQDIFDSTKKLKFTSKSLEDQLKKASTSALNKATTQDKKLAKLEADYRDTKTDLDKQAVTAKIAEVTEIRNNHLSLGQMYQEKLQAFQLVPEYYKLLGLKQEIQNIEHRFGDGSTNRKAEYEKLWNEYKNAEGADKKFEDYKKSISDKIERIKTTIKTAQGTIQENEDIIAGYRWIKTDKGRQRFFVGDKGNIADVEKAKQSLEYNKSIIATADKNLAELENNLRGLDKKDSKGRSLLSLTRENIKEHEEFFKNFSSTHAELSNKLGNIRNNLLENGFTEERMAELAKTYEADKNDFYENSTVSTTVTDEKGDKSEKIFTTQQLRAELAKKKKQLEIVRAEVQNLAKTPFRAKLLTERLKDVLNGYTTIADMLQTSVKINDYMKTEWFTKMKTYTNELGNSLDQIMPTIKGYEGDGEHLGKNEILVAFLRRMGLTGEETAKVLDLKTITGEDAIMTVSRYERNFTSATERNSNSDLSKFVKAVINMSIDTAENNQKGLRKSIPALDAQIRELFIEESSRGINDGDITIAKTPGTVESEEQLAIETQRAELTGKDIKDIHDELTREAQEVQKDDNELDNALLSSIPGIGEFLSISRALKKAGVSKKFDEASEYLRKNIMVNYSGMDKAIDKALTKLHFPDAQGKLIALRKQFMAYQGMPLEIQRSHQETLSLMIKMELASMQFRKQFSGLSSEEMEKVHNYLISQVANVSKDLGKNDAEAAWEAKQLIREVGASLVRLGMLNPKTFKANEWSYLNKSYYEHMGNVEEYLARLSQKKTISGEEFKKRKDEEATKMLNVIKDPAITVAKTVALLGHDLAIAEHYARIRFNKDLTIGNQEWNKLSPKDKEALSRDFVKMENNRKLGLLRNQYVRKDVAQYVEDFGKISFMYGQTDIQKAWKTAYRGATRQWKMFHVAWSPAAQLRNIGSNFAMQYLAGMPLNGKMQIQSLKEMYNGFINNQQSGRYKMAIEDAVFRSTFINAEAVKKQIGNISELMNHSPENALDNYGNVVRLMKLGKKYFDKGQAQLGDFYQFMEQWNKLALYEHALDNLGYNRTDAAMFARKWGIDYMNVSKANEIMRWSPIASPLCTYTLKAIPLMLEAAVRSPHKVAVLAMLPAIMSGAFAYINHSTREEDEEWSVAKRLMPDWMRPFHFASLNNIKLGTTEVNGKRYLEYIDVLYWTPFATLGSTVQKGFPDELFLSNPLTNIPIELFITNQEIWKMKQGMPPSKLIETDDNVLQRMGKIAGHAARSYFPTFAPGGKDFDKIINLVQGNKDRFGRDPNAFRSILDIVGGIRTNLGNSNEFRIQRAKEIDREINDLKGNIGYLNTQYSQGRIQKDSYIEQTDHLIERIKNYNEHRKELFNK